MLRIAERIRAEERTRTHRHQFLCIDRTYIHLQKRSHPHRFPNPICLRHASRTHSLIQLSTIAYGTLRDRIPQNGCRDTA
ncbi:hypothetical protein [Argonema antarcticum]|uniref:hypothetical protein n=1 Tax=Argonema antarcticum TaxID=2942763 RepID=UPI002011A6A7|nr:hypothetical protein [Argonema antarcticum]MCL1475789.1 hypothetical protein [Argonema antarcticum A004/B2]